MHVHVCASIYEFWGQNYVKGGKNVKPRKIRNFQKWKNDIHNNNCQNGLGKPRKFSRSRMTKLTMP